MAEEASEETSDETSELTFSELVLIDVVSLIIEDVELFPNGESASVITTPIIKPKINTRTNNIRAKIVIAPRFELGLLFAIFITL